MKMIAKLIRNQFYNLNDMIVHKSAMDNLTPGRNDNIV